MLNSIGLSRFRSAKLRWLFSHRVARRHPVRTTWRLLSWELIRLSNVPVESRYDGAFDITLMPNEGASRLTYYFGVSEPELFSFYEEFLKPGMVVADAGANIGLHTLFFAKRVGPLGSVYAFEPGAAAFKRLQAHVKRNQLSNVHCFHCALGAAEGRVSLVEIEEDSSRNFVANDPLTFGADNEVKLRPLDQVLREAAVEKVDFLKLDVEGFEPEVLKGAIGYLSRQEIRVLQLELDERSLARSGSTADSVSDMLCRFGYQRAEWSHQDSCFRPVDKASLNTFFVTDYELAHHA